MEPLGSWSNHEPGTLLGFDWSSRAAFWVTLSSVLGLVVTLTTFLFIAATSSLTYNVSAHCVGAASAVL